jgi:transposase
MAKTNRNHPKNARSSDATTTVFDFERRFPDDSACLDALVEMLYPDGIHCPKCDKVTRHHRLKNRPAFACQWCGHLEYPMKGTIFEGSSTSLKLWFYAIFLMASTRCGISAKQLEREVGVSYPTALRMFRQIRSLLGQGDVLLSGTVEADETYVGGKPRASERARVRDAAQPWKAQSEAVRRGLAKKQTVAGVAQRRGKVAAKVVPNSRRETLVPFVTAKVLPASVVYTDELPSYSSLGDEGFAHSRINHTEQVYVSGDVHTNTIEGFWALLKNGLRGVYHSVSDRHLQSYVDEYVFRYNHRDAPGGMFNAMLGRIDKS